MALEPVKIPQNVYIEDRIVGPLTLRQIIIVAIGGGFSYMIYASVTKAYGNVGIIPTIIIWIPALVATFFAFVKVNDLSLLRLVLLAAERFSKPSLRLFEPRTGITIHFRTTKEDEEKRKPVENVRHDDELVTLSQILDKPTVEESAGLSIDGLAPARTVPVRPADDLVEDPVDHTSAPSGARSSLLGGAPPRPAGAVVFRDLTAA